MLFKEIVRGFSENNSKLSNQNEELLIVKVAGGHSYHSALKDKSGIRRGCYL
jgi:hypothetical protein